jgi:two-component system sensor histidine kinase PhcS
MSVESNKKLDRFYNELGDLRVAYSKAGCITSALLVLLGSALDLYVYPHHWSEFLEIRLGISVATLAVLWVLYTPVSKAAVRGLTLAWLCLPQMMICWFIFRTEGSDSIYFVGLLLALYGVGIILPIRLAEGLAFCVITCVGYAIACVSRDLSPGDMNTMIGRLLMIAFAAGICVMCSYFNELLRIRLFTLQQQVAEKNTELTVINASLAKIKGKMIQQEKMAALGTLSAGLMHEVNNPVNYAMMALNMALMDPVTSQNAALKESLGDVQQGMQRVQSIVMDLKTFAYQTPKEDLHRVFLFEGSVRSALRLTGFELKGVDVTVDLPLDTHVRGDEPAMIGVLINLFSNAALALRQCARVMPLLRVVAGQRGDKLWVSVWDNGSGIKPENLTRIFEPFFTTRDVGQGLGLGLSLSYSIIQRHGGELLVRSEPGRWTEFSFDLPLAHPRSDLTQEPRRARNPDAYRTIAGHSSLSPQST